mmetsp:Transcript_23393/g.39140  ORF Transcript_23393/g.39140 Transcript_23393/m.39140 type:complete len:124 (+) Transcript_23393:1201-1572(+)
MHPRRSILSHPDSTGSLVICRSLPSMYSYTSSLSLRVLVLCEQLNGPVPVPVLVHSDVTAAATASVDNKQAADFTKAVDFTAVIDLTAVSIASVDTASAVGCKQATIDSSDEVSVTFSLSPII